MSKHHGPNAVSDSITFAIDPSNYRSYTGATNSVYDLSSNMNDFVASPGLSWSFFDGFDFGLTASVIESKYTNSISSKLTLNAWIKCPLIANRNQTIFSNGQIMSPQLGVIWIYRNINDNMTIAYDQSTGSTAYVTVSGYFQNFSNVWMNLCVSIDYLDNKMVVYRNGQIFFSISLTNSVPPLAGRLLTIGHNRALAYISGLTPPNNTLSSFSEFFGGKIGNVYLYSRILTQEEALRNYEAFRGRYGV